MNFESLMKLLGERKEEINRPLLPRESRSPTQFAFYFRLGFFNQGERTLRPRPRLPLEVI